MGFTNVLHVVQEVTLYSCTLMLQSVFLYNTIKTRCVAFINCTQFAGGGSKPFALTYQWISKRFSSLWVRSIVELG